MWTIQENSLIGQPIGETSAAQCHALGTIVRAKDPAYGAGEFVYLKGVASTEAGSWVTYNMDDGGTTLTTTGSDGPIAVSMSANVANQYGWYQIQGKAVGKVLTGFADNGDVFVNAAAGSVDDSGTVLIHNARAASAIGTPSAGLAEIEIARPFVLMT